MNGAAGTACCAVAETPEVKRRAPTLYCIIGLKLGKGVLLILMAVVVFALAGHDLAAEFRSLLRGAGLDPNQPFWRDLAAEIGRISATNIIWVGLGTLALSVVAGIEGIGLLYRASWAGWLAIGRAGCLMLVELYDLSHHFRWVVVLLLGVNLIVFWYLFVNRHRLFRHPHPHHSYRHEHGKSAHRSPGV